MRPTLMIMFVIFTFFGVCIGLLIGQKMAQNQTSYANIVPASNDELDAFYTNTLNVSDKQKHLIAAIDKNYLTQKQINTEQMVAANSKLASIIEEQGYENSDVAEIVMETNRIISAQQHLTLQHLTQIQKVLTKGQAELLRGYVIQKLRQQNL